MPTLGIITSSARPNRVGAHVAQWVREQVPSEWDVVALDLAEKPLPFFDGDSSPKQGLPRTERHAIDWAESIEAVDALVITTPEYNGSYPAILKNAIDYLYAELTALPIALVGYGWAAGAGAIADSTRLLTRLGATVVGETGLSFGADLDVDGTVHAGDEAAESLRGSLQGLREAVREAPAA